MIFFICLQKFAPVYSEEGDRGKGVNPFWLRREDILSDPDVANYKQEIKRRAPYDAICKVSLSLENAREFVCSLSLFSFLPPIRRECHRLILGNVTSGKLEHEYIAREGTPLLCDSRREFSLRWDSITGTALSSRDFSEASFHAECATLTLQVYSRGGGCGSHQNYISYVAYRCLRFLASFLLGQNVK